MSYFEKWITDIIRNRFPGGGGGVTGAPNALVRINPAGDGAATDADLTAAPIDQFNRPQILDRRQAAGLGSVWRQGGWRADGDPVNKIGEGIVIYDPIDDATGNYARVKGSRFGIFRIFGALADYAWRVDLTHLFLRNDAAETTFEVTRADGALRASASLGVGPDGAAARVLSGDGSPEGVIVGDVGDLFLRRDGGAGTIVYEKESGSGTANGWAAVGGGGAPAVGIRDQCIYTPDSGGWLEANTPGISGCAGGGGQVTINLSVPLTLLPSGFPKEHITATALKVSPSQVVAIIELIGANSVAVRTYNVVGGALVQAELEFSLAIFNNPFGPVV